MLNVYAKFMFKKVSVMNKIQCSEAPKKKEFKKRAGFSVQDKMFTLKRGTDQVHQPIVPCPS